MTDKTNESTIPSAPHWHSIQDQTAFLTSVLEASTEYSIVAMELDGTILAWNEGARRIYGYEQADVLGKVTASVLHIPEDVGNGLPDRIFADVHRIGKWEGALRHMRKNGEQFSAHVTMTLRRDPAGTASGFTMISRDLSESDRIWQELQKSEQKFRHLLEAAPDAMIIVDEAGKIVLVNAQVEKVFEYRREELLGQPIEFLIPERFRGPHVGHRTKYSEKPSTRPLGMGLNLYGLRKNGTEFPIEISLSPLETESGTLISSSIRDISEQKRLEEQITNQNRELSETSTFLNNILESSTEYSIIAKDIKGNILKWNEGAHRTYGYTADEMVGKQNSSILHTKEDVESGRMEEAHRTAFQTGTFEGEFQRVRKNGEQFTAQVAITLRRDLVGNPIGYVLISKDITEQKALKEQIRRKNEELEEQYRRVQAANRLKSEFLANMSHELRSPLNSIIGFAQLMHDGKVGPMADQHKEFLGDILTSSNHLLQLINDVLDLAKVESGKMEFHPEKVELKKLAGEVCVVLRQLAANKRIRIESHTDASLVEVVTDPAKLKQVLYNFLSNAIKFTPDGGHVTLRFLPENDTHYRLEVEDTGIGIKQEDFSRLFVEFQQLDASTAKKYQGTGLGLALTKRVAESQGGQVGMKSELGKGSVFFAVLPRVLKAGSQANAIAVMPSPIQQQPASAGYPRILVVEDRPSDLAWLQTTLSQAGYQVQTAQTGKEAVELAMRHQFDVITMDLLLPDTSGRDVLKAIRTESQNRDTPVVIVTVVADHSLVGEYEVYDILGKPVEAESLLHTLRRARMPRTKERPILIIDNEPAVLKLLMEPFIARGYRTILETDAEQGLVVADKECPAAVILDLRMPGLDGFHFLSRFRRREKLCGVPVIVWTALDLTENQHNKLNAMVQGVVEKTSGVDALLATFDACLKPLAKKKVA